MLTVIKPFGNGNPRERRMDEVLHTALAGVPHQYVLTVEALAKRDLRGGRLLFAVCLTEAGVNLEYYRMLEYFRANPGCLAGACAGVVVDGSGELFTKSLARRLIFSANLAGCTFPGKPLVEATGSLQNFHIMSQVLGTDAMGAYRQMARDLVQKVLTFAPARPAHPRILAVHASSRKTSNSLLLWETIAARLSGRADITEISLRNGALLDCRGCKYEDCLHFGEKEDCFYGGVMVEQVYPAIIRCDRLVMICPNYNDAVSANITAFINRLTAVFRTHDFSAKEVYALVVSGYSGGDIVAEQIIGAMNLNKSFILPAHFALVETAHDPGSILQVPDLAARTADFADRLLGIADPRTERQPDEEL